jgi:pimeloyl-ACP methyl ester carboxylesterase
MFIHGSWHSPKHFGPVRAIFEAKGYPTEHPRLPTFGPKPAPPIVSVEDDVRVVQELLTELIDEQGKDVIVVLHSYGGFVGTQAVLAVWGKKAREARGLPGGVVHLLYICAFVLPLGASIATPYDGDVSPPIVTVLVRVKVF